MNPDFLPTLNEILRNPLFQSTVAPFAVALVAAELFQRVRLSGLAIILAFSIVLILANDFVFWPLTALRKLALVSLIGAGLALVIDALLKKSRFAILLAPLIAGLATLWVLSSAFSQLAPENKWQYAGGVVLFVAWLAAACDGLRDDSVQAGAAGWGLGLGAGLTAWLTASALPGKFALAVGSASAAYLFIQIFSSQRLPAGRIYVLPAALITGLAAAAAVMLGTLPWIVLPVLAAIPLMVRLQLSKQMSLRGQVLLAATLATIPAAVCVFIVWRSAGFTLQG
jgi:hypothetical protein